MSSLRIGSYFLELEVEALSEQSGQVGRDLELGLKAVGGRGGGRRRSGWSVRSWSLNFSISAEPAGKGAKWESMLGVVT